MVRFVMYVPPALAAICGGIGRFSLVPLLPHYIGSLGGDAFWVGLFMSGQGIGTMFGTVWLGYFSDMVGVKTAMLTALACNIPLFFLSGVVKNLPLLVVVRILLGLFSPFSTANTWNNKAAGTLRHCFAHFTVWVPIALGNALLALQFGCQ